MKKAFLFTLFGLGACQPALEKSQNFEDVLTTPNATESLLTTSLTTNPDTSELRCEMIYDVEKLAEFTTYSNVIIGEAHGYNEPAQFTEELLCQSSKNNLKISLGLELSYSMNAKLQAYFNSAGRVYDKERFLSDPIWSSPFDDGRHTLAIFDVIEYARKLREMGHDLNIYAFQASNLSSSDVTDKDSFNKLYEIALYNNILEFTKLHSPEKNIVLVGNAHARVGIATFGGSSFKTMASYFLDPNTIRLNYKVSSEKKGDVEILSQSENGYDGIYYIEDMTKASKAKLK